MRKRTGFLLILFLALYFAAAVREFALHMDVSDDTVWYYYIGSGVASPSVFERELQFLPAAKELAEDEITWQRLRLRAGYTGNYVIPTFVCFHVGEAMADARPRASFVEHLSAALYWGYLAALIVGAVFAAMAFLAASRSLQIPLVTALALIAALDLLSLDGATGVLSSTTSSARELIAIAYRLTLIFIDPHYAIAPFGPMARNQVILLALGVYALRWSGKPAAAYAFMIVLLLFHQSMAFLLLASLLAVDAATRPQIFRDRRCAWAAGAALAIAVIREAHWSGIGRAGWMVLAASAAIGIALIGLVALAQRRPLAGWSIGAGAYGLWLDSWQRKGMVVTDVLGLSCLFAMALVVAVIANEFAQPFSQQYFWAVLPGRLFALLRPLYYLAAAIWIGRWIEGAGSRLAVAGAALSILAALILVEIRLTPPLGKVPERMASALGTLDASLGRPSHVFRIEDEALFYYALVKSLNSGSDYVRATWIPRSQRSSTSSPPAPAGNEVREQPPAR